MKLKTLIDAINKSIESSIDTERIWDLQKRYSNAFNDNMLNILKEFRKILDNDSEKLATILLELGWPPRRDFYNEELIEIVSYYDNNEKEKVKKTLNNYLLEKYQGEKIIKIINKWDKEPILHKRLEILHEAIKAHKNGNYYLSVATLLPQVEGIIADGFGYKREMFDLKGNIKKLFKHYDSFEQKLQEYYTEKILDSFEHNTEIDFSLNRHAIVHGGDVNFGYEINSLKAILFLDTIQGYINIIKIKEEDKYHQYGCEILENKRNEEWLPYRSVVYINDKNKIPCERCKPNKI